MNRDRFDARLVKVEHHVALQRIRRVVKVHDRLLATAQRFVGAFNEFIATLDEHLNRHVVGNQVLFNELANEIKVRLAGRREAHFNFGETDLAEFFEHTALAFGVHGVDESLIAVAQVDRTPQRSFVDHLVGPRAVGEHQRDERLVPVECHAVFSGIDELC